MQSALMSHFISFISASTYAYSVVEFAYRDDMEYALRKMQDSDLNGSRVQLFEVSGLQ